MGPAPLTEGCQLRRSQYTAPGGFLPLISFWVLCCSSLGTAPWAPTEAVGELSSSGAAAHLWGLMGHRRPPLLFDLVTTMSSGREFAVSWVGDSGGEDEGHLLVCLLKWSWCFVGCPRPTRAVGEKPVCDVSNL